MNKTYTIIKKEKNKYDFIEKKDDKKYDKRGEIAGISGGMYGNDIMKGIRFSNIESCCEFFAPEMRNSPVYPSYPDYYPLFKNSCLAFPEIVDENSLIMDTSKVKDFRDFMCNNSLKLRIFTPKIDYSSAENMTDAFYLLENLEKIHDINSGKCIYFNSTFSSCEKLKTVNIDTSSAKYIIQMFSGCSEIDNLNLKTDNVINFSRAFEDCKKLKNINLSNFSRGMSFQGMFSGCESLKEIDFRNEISTDEEYLSYEPFKDMFRRCLSLETIKGLDFGGYYTYPDHTYEVYYNSFTECYNLINLDIKNIKLSLDLRWSSKLSEDSILKVAKELHSIPESYESFSRTVFFNDNDRIKNYLNNTYCKILDPQDEKKPMEIVDNSVENAITLSDYITKEKRWKLKYFS